MSEKPISVDVVRMMMCTGLILGVMCGILYLEHLSEESEARIVQALKDGVWVAPNEAGL